MLKWWKAAPLVASLALLFITPLTGSAKPIDDGFMPEVSRIASTIQAPTGQNNDHGYMMFWVNEHFDTVAKDFPGMNHGQVMSMFAHLNKDKGANDSESKDSAPNQGKGKNDSANPGKGNGNGDTGNNDGSNANNNQGNGNNSGNGNHGNGNNGEKGNHGDSNNAGGNGNGQGHGNG